MSASFVHAGVAVSSLDHADRFYGGLLGLARSDIKELSAEQCDLLFGVAKPMQMMHYTGPGADFEIFVCDGLDAPGPVAHACVSVANREGFMCACRDAGLKVTEFPKGDRLIVFVTDFDGNLFEVTER